MERVTSLVRAHTFYHLRTNICCRCVPFPSWVIAGNVELLRPFGSNQSTIGCSFLAPSSCLRRASQRGSHPPLTAVELNKGAMPRLRFLYNILGICSRTTHPTKRHPRVSLWASGNSGTDPVPVLGSCFARMPNRQKNLSTAKRLVYGCVAHLAFCAKSTETG